MLQRQRQIRAQVQKLADMLLFALSFWVAHQLRWHWETSVLQRTPEIEAFSEFLWLVAVISPLSPLLLELQGFYARPLVASRRRTLWQAFKACTLCVLLVISVMFLAKQSLARSVIILFGPVSLFILLLKEELIRQWVETQLGKGQLQRRFILVGTKADVTRLRSHLGHGDHDGMALLAQVDLNENTVDHLVDLVHKHSANGVILSAKHTYFGQIEKAIQACELEGVEAWLLADFLNTHLSRTVIDDFYGRPILVFRSTPEESWQAMAKMAVDFAGALFVLLLTLPLLLLVPILIRLSSPGPIFFQQQRSGVNGRPFTMLKFRTMVTNAEQRKQELAAFNEMDGPVFKITNDPRITPLGRWLRKYSIDELPQLLNVLRGEMSLVGPRPLPVDEVMRFDDLAHRRRLSVKPGLTCLWQVSGRNNVTDFKEWVRLDLEYIDNWSIWLDLKILARTVPVVLLGTGAK